MRIIRINLVRDLFILILFSFLIIFAWFFNGELFSGAEESLSFYNYQRTFSIYSSIWYDTGTGYKLILNLPKFIYFGIGAFFSKMGFVDVLIQAVTFFVLIFLGMVSVYFITRESLKAKVDNVSLSRMAIGSALFYLFNPFVMSQIWGRGLSFLIFGFCLVPLFLLCFILSINRNSVWLAIGLFFSLIFSATYSNPALILTSWFSIGVYTIYAVVVNQNNKKNLYKIARNFLIYLGGWALVQGFWLYPFIDNGSELLGINLGARDNLESMKGLAINSGLVNVLRLWHREYYDGTYSVALYNNIFVLFLSWFNLIVVLCSFLLIKRAPVLRIFWIIFLCSVIVCIGYNFPTGDLLVWLFKVITPLQVLRNPYEKFGLNLTLAYSVLWGIGAVVISELFRKKWKVGADCLWLGMLVYIVFCLSLPYWDRSFAGGTRSNFWVEVPTYYEDANNWLNSQPDNKRLLQLPLPVEDGVTYTWPKAFDGVDGSEYLFDRSSISRNIGINRDYYTRLLELIGGSSRLPGGLFLSPNDYFNNDTFVSLMEKLNIGYIIIHRDVNSSIRFGASTEHVRKFIEKNSNIRKAAVFGELDLYKIDSTSEASLIYSPEVDLTFKHTNNTVYEVDIIKGVSENARIYFLTQFDPSWSLFVNNKEVKNHFMLWNYANGWETKINSSDKINIIYNPQKKVEQGILSTKIAVICLLIWVTFYCIKKLVR